MSLFDESFPTDIFHKSIDTNPKAVTDALLHSNDKAERSIYDQSSLSLICNEDPPSSSSTMSGPLSTSPTATESNSQDKSDYDSKGIASNSGNSQEKVIGDGSFANTSKGALKKKKFINHKSKSYQDLHSEYTKKKYQHVQSKVQQYIANMRAQDNRRKSKAKAKYHVHLPQTTNNNNYDSMLALLAKRSSEPNNIFQQNTLEILNEQIGDHEINHENVNISKMLSEKEQLLTELKIRNDYLQSNLDDKAALAARYKRNADHLQVELLQLKEREKRFKETHYNRYGQRMSLPTSSYSIFNAGTDTVSTSTQTDLIPQQFVLGDGDYLNFSDTLDFLKINGNSGRGGNTNSMIIFSLEDETDIDENNIQSSDNILGNQLRRRSNSTSLKFQKNITKLNAKDENGISSSLLADNFIDVDKSSKNSGSDSAIESDQLLQIDDDDDDKDDEDIINDIRRPFLRTFKCSRKTKDPKIMIGDGQSTSAILKKTQKQKNKKRVFKKIYLKTLFGSCVKCCKYNNSNGIGNNDTISYQGISMSESLSN